MRGRTFSTTVAWLVCALLATALLFPGPSEAKTRAEINAQVNTALLRFIREVRGARTFLNAAKGVLVFPGVIQAGAGIGGEYGEGALRIRGTNVAYYSIAAASIGFQLGAQRKDILIAFMDEGALRQFMAKRAEWQVGVDGSIVLVNVGASASIDTMKIDAPIVGFVFGQRGLMYNLTLEGTRIRRINPQ